MDITIVAHQAKPWEEMGAKAQAALLRAIVLNVPIDVLTRVSRSAELAEDLPELHLAIKKIVASPQ